MSESAPAARWREGDGAALAARVIDRWVGGGDLAGLPLERHEDRVDLRGFAVPDPEVLGEAVVAGDGVGTGVRRVTGLVKIGGATLTDLDLSGARLDHLRFHDTTVRNCRFDGASCRDWRGRGLTVEDCSFRRASLRGAALGTGAERANRYRRTDFDGADMREIVCLEATFEDCDLSNARLDHVEFGGCTFVRCRFAGLLDEVTFAGSPFDAEPGSGPSGALREVDLSRAVLRIVEFRDIPMDGVIPPADGESQVVVGHRPCVVRGALARLKDRDDALTHHLRIVLEVGARDLDERGQLGVWAMDELGETDEQRRFAADLLREVERECARG
jgi:hypothetical protein